MATVKKTVKKAQKGVKATPSKKTTPFKEYLKKYPKAEASDTTVAPYSDWDNKPFAPSNRYANRNSPKYKDLNSAFAKTYSNYDSELRSFEAPSGRSKEIEDGVRRSGMKKGGVIKKSSTSKMKAGGKTMMKRADGSTSQRGLWDNIRAAKGSGKKPTAQMLKQEKKIKSKKK